MIAAGLMIMSMGVATWAEPVEKSAASQPAPAPIVTTTQTQSQTPTQPEVKKDQGQPAPAAPAKKPIELNFRTF